MVTDNCLQEGSLVVPGIQPQNTSRWEGKRKETFEFGIKSVKAGNVVLDGVQAENGKNKNTCVTAP